MFDSDRMSEELRTLKVDVTRLLSTAGEEMFDSSKDRAEALADQIRAALAELGETFDEEQEQLQASLRTARSHHWPRPSRSAWSSASCCGGTKVNTENV